ncbi:MAG: hypothetical protein KAI24_21495 [Planctomycetes bacterium]|nr:hypothetical protein [Planctomycetota bacterium]
MNVPGLFVGGLLSTSACVAQTTWIVDAAGGGQFTTLAAAHDTAAPGDTLLVQPGSYDGLYRQPAKGLRILGDGPGVVITTEVRLADVPPGQTLQISGLTIDTKDNNAAPTGGASFGLEVHACDNLVLSDLTVLGPDAGGWQFEGGQAVTLLNCNGVMSHVVAVGGDGGDANWVGDQGGEGAWLVLCNFAIADCHFTSGDSGVGPGGTLATRPALLCGSGVFAVDQCTLVQGTPNQDNALTVSNADVLLANHSGGVSSYSASASSTLEYEGPAMSSPWYSSPASPRPQPGLSGPASAAIGTSITWALHGGAGEVAAVAASVGADPFMLPGLFDTYLFTATHPTTVLLPIVVTGPGGSTTFSVVVPNVPALIDTFLFTQAAGWLGQPTWKASGVAVTRIG